MFGVLNIHKPLHCTSHDVVAKVRKKLNIKKVGHAGTLDPLAEGVLPVCVGDATRLIEYFPGDKRYRARVTFGQTTTTWDSEGDIVCSMPARGLTAADVEQALHLFEGRIQQQVPPHAAVHVKGKKLYEYARKGIAMELPVRETEIFEIRMESFLQAGTDHPVAVLDIHCASGTYIRSIAQTLGNALGTGAFLSGLVRTCHGKFLLEESVPLDTFLSAEHPERFLLNPIPFLPFPVLEISPESVAKVQHGMKLLPKDLTTTIRNGRNYLLAFKSMPVAVAQGEETGRLKPLKVFHLVSV